MGRFSSVSSLLSRLNRLKDPNAWVCLIAVFVILGLMGGAFEPASMEGSIHDAGMNEASSLEVALRAPLAAEIQPG